MNKAKINALYEQAHVVYEVPYESSVVDPSIVSVHKQKVWDRYLFAELIVRECIKVCEPVFLDEPYEDMSEFGKGLVEGQDVAVEKIKEHFGVAE